MLDILNLISEQTTAVALAIVVMWFYNRLVVDVLKERKEMVEAIRLERKEWLTTADYYLKELIAITKAMVEAITNGKSEMHALKGKITELILVLGKSREVKNE